MNKINNILFVILTSVSRKLNFLPRGKVGIRLNKIFGNINTNPLKKFKANNGLTYFADIRSYTENYVPWTGEYEGKTIDKILQIVPKDANILDIGGNVGYWSVNLAEHINSGNTVSVFEPFKKNSERIKEILEANNLENKSKVYQLGLGDKNEKVGFRISQEDQENGSDSFNAQLLSNENGDIKVTTFDELDKKENFENIGFIKIDIEGYEIKFLRGAKKFFSKNKPIIYGEFTPQDIKQNNDDPKFIYEFFKDYLFYQETKDSFVKLKEGQDFTRDLLLIPKQLETKISNILKI